MRSRTGGKNETRASKTTTTPNASSHRLHRGAGSTAFPQSGREACSICVRKSLAERDELRRDDCRKEDGRVGVRVGVRDEPGAAGTDPEGCAPSELAATSGSRCP